MNPFTNFLGLIFLQCALAAADSETVISSPPPASTVAMKGAASGSNLSGALFHIPLALIFAIFVFNRAI